MLEILVEIILRPYTKRECHPADFHETRFCLTSFFQNVCTKFHVNLSERSSSRHYVTDTRTARPHSEEAYWTVNEAPRTLI